jgi:hypothetical protein
MEDGEGDGLGDWVMMGIFWGWFECVGKNEIGMGEWVSI